MGNNSLYIFDKLPNRFNSLYTSMNLYIYICVCVCVCVYVLSINPPPFIGQLFG